MVSRPIQRAWRAIDSAVFRALHVASEGFLWGSFGLEGSRVSWAFTATVIYFS